ncbi:holo-ACP synthase [Campylobacter coli]|nr:holo-ACP synthase [Campylobacter coli]EDP5051850.1 holo-ACP synthase [Campylobacter jejuni]EAJ6072951.1 holo-ACP synthase [Campylobacter coli]EAJ7402792.1 holo-ACP synthase [Campylobacter coli]ECQ1772769.1 holo-ACP synthase [Campylobacter coli]
MRIGCDIVAISRIDIIYQKHGNAFLDKFLNKNEQKLIKSSSTLAGFWAAKEAVSKALGVGISKECGFLDIEILKDSKNAPHLKLASHVLENFKINSTSLSISHDNGFAIAVVALG